jgi:transcriptional regulator with XRE-family HTH domain
MTNNLLQLSDGDDTIELSKYAHLANRRIFLDKKTLGKVLRTKRKELKISLIEMASNNNLSPSYLSSLERGNVDKTRYDKILKISKGYQIPLDTVRSAFKADSKEAEASAHMDIILKQMAADEKLKLRKLFQQVLEDGELGNKAKLLVIRLYEHIYRKKLL